MRKAVLPLTVLTPSKRMMLTLLAACLVGMALYLGVGIRSADTQTTAPTYYKVQALGTLPGATYSPPTSVPYGINDFVGDDFGHVVGYAALYGGYVYEGWGDPYYLAFGHAFLYDGAMKDLGTFGGTSSGGISGAAAINNNDQVVGYSQFAAADGSWMFHAFLYDSANGMTDLGTLGGTDSRAYGINDSGQVVGYAAIAGNQNSHAFLYKDGKMTDLGLLGGTYTDYYSNSYAYDINNKGQVVGESAYDDSGYRHAFLYDSVNGMKDLGALGSTNSWATAINDSGEVVGTSPTSYTTGDQDYHAFLYKDGKMTDLGTLGGTNSNAYGINDSGQVVGYSDNDQSNTPYNHAFLYQNEKMIDLGTRTHPDSDGNVWDLGAARGINNKGQIVVDGSRTDANGTTVYSALLLTPTSDPPPADTQAPSAPTISSPQNNTYDSDGSFSVSGSAQAGSTVELFEGTTSKGTTKADSSTGAWSIDLTGVSEGSHTYSTKATDAAGNTSSASNTVTVTVDTQAPSPPTIISPADNSYDPDGNITFSGTAEKGSTVKVYQDGATTAAGQATASTTDGSWTINLTGVSEQSTAHTFGFTATDAAGNESREKTTWHVTVQKAPPAPSSLTASQSGTTTSQNIKLAWKDNSNNEKNFVLERRPAKQTNWTVLSSALAPNTTSYTDTNISRRTTYYYRVKATNDAGSSDYSNTASATTK